MVEAVGAGADDEAGDAGDGECFAVEALELVDGLVGVGKRLKISEI